MALRISTDLFCDICADWIGGGDTSHKVEGRATRKMAKEFGWQAKIIDRELHDICPKCVEILTP